MTKKIEEFHMKCFLLTCNWKKKMKTAKNTYFMWSHQRVSYGLTFSVYKLASYYHITMEVHCCRPNKNAADQIQRSGLKLLQCTSVSVHHDLSKKGIQCPY